MKILAPTAFAAAAALLAGCTISTELGPEGFQGWKKGQPGTGTNIPRGDPEADRNAGVRYLGNEDVGNLQRNYGSAPAKGSER